MFDSLLIAGDSILKGVQPDPDDGQYRTRNIIDYEEATGLCVKNISKFGCTVTKGSPFILQSIDKSEEKSIVLMDFGGNDSDYNWLEVVASPNDFHSPKTPLNLFIETYCRLIGEIRSRGCFPVITTLPPIVPERYFDWLCRTLKINARLFLHWLRYVDRLGEFQSLFSDAVAGIAKVTDTPLIDLRGAFTSLPDFSEYICIDGIHPNDKGQRILHNKFRDFFRGDVCKAAQCRKSVSA